MRYAHLLAMAATAVIMTVAATPASAQATRTQVSGVGDDVNPCSRTAPCKTFAGAISKTATGGEINCIDPGGYGAVTVTKSITIDCAGTLGSILAAGTNGIVVNAASANVTIRNISINGAGTGLNGIRFLQSGALRVENVQIFNFVDKGIDFIPTGNSELMVLRSEIYNNGNAATDFAINIRPTGAASAIATIDRTVVQNNTTGILFDSSGTSAVIGGTIVESTVAGNTGTGITAKAGPSVFLSINRTVSSFNGTGVQADGANAGVLLSNSIVNGNSTGLSLINSGVIGSNTTNFFLGNLGVNGAPSSTVPPQ